MNKTFSVIFSMELKRFLGNKKILISAFLLPVLLLSVIVFGITNLEQTDKQGRIFLYCSEEIMQTVSNSQFGDVNDFVVFSEMSTFNDIVSSERNSVGIYIDEQNRQITVGYNSELLSNPELLYTANEISNKLNIALNATDLYGNYVSSTPVTIQKDVSSENSRVASNLRPLLIMSSIIAVMLACMSLVTLSADTISGERERGSFDILRLSGSKLSVVVLGKTIFLAMLGFFVLLFEAMAIFMSLKLFNPGLVEIVAVGYQNTWKIVVSLIVSLIELALLCPTCFVLLSSMFEKAKQATSYCSIGMTVISLSVSISAFCSHDLLAYIPIVNLPVMILQSINNQNTTNQLIISSLIAVLLSILMLSFASSNIERNSSK